MGLPAFVRANHIDFGVAEEPVLFPFNFKHGIMYDLRAFEDPRRFDVTHPTTLVRYRDECHYNGLGGVFALAPLDRYRHYATDLFQNPSLAEQSQFTASLSSNNSGAVDSSNDLVARMRRLMQLEVKTLT